MIQIVEENKGAYRTAIRFRWRSEAKLQCYLMKLICQSGQFNYVASKFRVENHQRDFLAELDIITSTHLVECKLSIFGSQQCFRVIGQLLYYRSVINDYSNYRFHREPTLVVAVGLIDPVSRAIIEAIPGFEVWELGRPDPKTNPIDLDFQFNIPVCVDKCIVVA